MGSPAARDDRGSACLVPALAVMVTDLHAAPPPLKPGEHVASCATCRARFAFLETDRRIVGDGAFVITCPGCFTNIHFEISMPPPTNRRVGSDAHVAVWAAIQQYVVACGGDPNHRWSHERCRGNRAGDRSAGG